MVLYVRNTPYELISLLFNLNVVYACIHYMNFTPSPGQLKFVSVCLCWREGGLGGLDSYVYTVDSTVMQCSVNRLKV